MIWIALACSNETVDSTAIESDILSSPPEEMLEDNNEQEEVEEIEEPEEELEVPQEEEPEEEEEPLSCDEGAAYWQSCTGLPLSPSLSCTEELYDELELAQALSCDTFLEVKEELPLCLTFGLNCPEEYEGCATEPLDAAAFSTILESTDTSTLTTIDEVQERNALLRQTFAEYGDIRGVFASVYSPITDIAVDTIEAGTFTHDAWVRALVIRFSARYYENLRASLLNQSTTQSWGRYYELSEDCSVSGLRIGVFGIAVHLMVDLPHTLVEISSSLSHKDDFELFGLALVEATPTIVQNLRDDFDIESEDFFHGFFLGDWIDSMAGDDATTTFAFQTIRNKAWNNAMWLQDWRFALAEAEIYTSWRSADGLLATWDIVQ